MVRRLRAAVVPLLLLCLAVPGIAQQPAPPAPPPIEDILEETAPEAEADRDLERMGQAAVRKKALGRLQNAQEDAPRNESGELAPSGPDDPAIQELRDAVRYYARAYGLPGLDGLTDELETVSGLSDIKSDLTRHNTEIGPALQRRYGPGVGSLVSAVFRLRRLKAREAAAPPKPPRTVSAADPAPGGGLSRNAKIGIGAGAGVVLVGVLAAGGGSNASPSAVPTPAPPLSPFNPAGTYDVTMTVRTDPGGNAPRIGMEPALVLVFTVTGSSAQYTCPPGSHINPGSGPVDLVSGAFNFAGVGGFAGRPNVQFLFPGAFGRDGTIAGEYRVGTGGELGPITTYAVSGRRRP